MIPSEISLPLKTTMSSRMRTIWAMTALNPISVRAARTADEPAPRAGAGNQFEAQSRGGG
jgi:hypothetical protein